MATHRKVEKNRVHTEKEEKENRGEERRGFEFGLGSLVFALLGSALRERVEMGIFEPYRAIGYITDNVPFVVQRRGLETFVTVSVGKSFQIFNVSSPLSPPLFFISSDQSIIVPRIFDTLVLFSFCLTVALPPDGKAVACFCW